MAARSDVHRAPYRSGLGEIRGLIFFGDARQAVTALIVANFCRRHYPKDQVDLTKMRNASKLNER
jgi:hypothetical protein